MNKRTASTRHPTMFRGAHYKKAINNQERGVYFSTCNQEHIETLAQIHSALMHVGQVGFSRKYLHLGQNLQRVTENTQKLPLRVKYCKKWANKSSKVDKN